MTDEAPLTLVQAVRQQISETGCSCGCVAEDVISIVQDRIAEAVQAKLGVTSRALPIIKAVS